MSYFDDNEDRIVSGKQGKIKDISNISFRKTFNRGYSEVRQRVEKGSKYTKSCYNCEHYYQAVGDKTEVCQNPNVLQYDMVVTETTIYCTQWRLSERASEPTASIKSVKGLFKKR